MIKPNTSFNWMWIFVYFVCGFNTHNTRGCSEWSVYILLKDGSEPSSLTMWLGGTLYLLKYLHPLINSINRQSNKPLLGLSNKPFCSRFVWVEVLDISLMIILILFHLLMGLMLFIKTLLKPYHTNYTKLEISLTHPIQKP